MKIKIIKASKPTLWYADKVGATFKVTSCGSDYVLDEDISRGRNTMWRHIHKADCVVLPKGATEGGDKDGQ